MLNREGRGPRVSVSGWFHGVPLPRPPPPLPPPVRYIEPRVPPDYEAPPHALSLVNPRPTSGSGDPLTAWVSPAYLRRGAMAAVAAQFARDASVQVRWLVVTTAHLCACLPLPQLG